MVSKQNRYKDALDSLVSQKCIEIKSLEQYINIFLLELHLLVYKQDVI